MDGVKSGSQADSQTGYKYEDLTDEVLVNHSLKEQEYLGMIRDLKVDLSERSDRYEILKMLYDDTTKKVDVLSQELNECKLTMFENSEDTKKTHEEIMKSKKLEEDYVKLMSEFLDLGEKSDQYRQNLCDNYLAKSNAINNLECLMSSGSLTTELENTKSELDNRLAEINLATAKIRNLEEENSNKDKNINELKKALDDAKVTHKHEITVLEEYIQCLKNTITSYEKTLAGYMEPEKPEELSVKEEQ